MFNKHENETWITVGLEIMVLNKKALKFKKKIPRKRDKTVIKISHPSVDLDSSRRHLFNGLSESANLFKSFVISNRLLSTYKG